MNKIEDQHLQGLFADTFHAKKNFKIYKKIQNVWPNIVNIDENEQELFAYLRNSSRDFTILHLAKLFDDKNKHHPTRCINDLISQIEDSEIKYNSSSFTHIKWTKFQTKYEDIINSIFIDEKPQIEMFLVRLKNHIETQKKTKGTIFNTLKVWRDKYLAHNESYEFDVRLEVHEIEALLLVPDSLLEFLNSFVSNKRIIVAPIIPGYFITHLINKTDGLQGDSNLKSPEQNNA